MSKQNPTRRTPPGVDERHARHCASRDANACDCNPTFQAYVYDKRARKLIRKTFPTRTAAKLWRQDALVAVRNGELSADRPKGTVRDALTALIDGMKNGDVLDRSGRRYRASTIRSYEAGIRRYVNSPAFGNVGNVAVAEVRRRDVQTLIDKMHGKGLAGSTIRNKLDPLRVLFRRAMEDDVLSRSPMTHLRLPALNAKPREIADPTRVGMLLNALPEAERALWAMAFYCGLRVGELRALRWKDVDFDGGVVRVVAAWDDVEGLQDPKTDAGVRTVPLSGRVRAEMVRHKLATGGSASDLCFGRTSTDAFVRTTVRSRARRAWKRAKLEPLTPHEARHTCASYLAAAGWAPKDAQTAMGHADIRTTLNVYAKAVPGWEKSAAAKLDAYLEGHAKAARKRARKAQ